MVALEQCNLGIVKIIESDGVASTILLLELVRSHKTFAQFSSAFHIALKDSLILWLPIEKEPVSPSHVLGRDGVHVVPLKLNCRQTSLLTNRNRSALVRFGSVNTIPGYSSAPRVLRHVSMIAVVGPLSLLPVRFSISIKSAITRSHSSA